MAQEVNPKIIEVEGNFIETFPAHFERLRGHKNRATTETIATPHGKITVHHNSRLFSAFDKDVLLAAFALARHAGQRHFRAVLSDFARLMRINPFGKNLVKIRESLNELAMTPAEFTESWRDAQNRRYTSETLTSFIAYRLVDRREIMENKLSPQEIRDGSWIAIPDLFYDSIENGYFRYIDAEVYFSLPSGLCRAAFLYFEKRLGIKNHYEENIVSALANIFKRPAKPQDIKNFKRRTIRQLSDIFIFDKKKLKKGMLAVSRRVLFNGAADGNFVPRTAISGQTDSSLKCEQLTPNQAEPQPPSRRRTFSASKRSRKKLDPRGEYVLERACILCNRDDEYFKNVVRKYIFLRGADLVAGAIGDTRDTAAVKSKSKYLIHLLKNL